MPWANNRPYKDGDLYNCLVIETKMKDVGKPHFETEELTVIDEVHSNSSIFCLVHLYSFARNVEFHTVQYAEWTKK